MPLAVRQGSVLDCKADAIIVTIDGAVRGLEGGVARQFSRNWPDAWDEAAGAVRYPLPLGEVSEVEPESECPFRVVILAATLHHADTHSESVKKSIVRTALENAIDVAADRGATTVACTLMKGGWRLGNDAAFLAMSEACEAALGRHRDIRLTINIPDEPLFRKIESFARQFGW